MKLFVIFAFVIGGLVPWSFGDEKRIPTPDLSVFIDPRITHFPNQAVAWIRKGEETREAPAANHPLLIISWMPAPDGGNMVYQISGLEGYHSRALVDLFLNEFYQMFAGDEAVAEATNILVAGNNWGSGLELGSTLKPLSKKYLIEASFLTNYGFRKASLMAEPKERLEMIKGAFKKAEESLKKK